MVADAGIASLILEETAIIIGGERVDPDAPDATRRVCELLGPIVHTTPAGLKGVPRTAHWLSSGIVVVSDKTLNDALTMIFVSFDAEDGSPYPQWIARLEPFAGSVAWNGRSFSGRTDEREVLGIPDLQGYGGMRHVKTGRLLLLFNSKRKRARTGHRTGPRMLVQLCAQWVRETSASSAIGEPWAD